MNLRPAAHYPPSTLPAERPSVELEQGQRLLALERGAIARLDQGANLLLPACGEGECLFGLARQFPRSRFAGTEASGTRVMQARRMASRLGLQNVWFAHATPAMQAHGAVFDFALVLRESIWTDAPAAVFRAFWAQLKAGGLLLLHGCRHEDLRHTQLPHHLRSAGFAYVRTASLASDPDARCFLVRK